MDGGLPLISSPRSSDDVNTTRLTKCIISSEGRASSCYVDQAANNGHNVAIAIGASLPW